MPVYLGSTEIQLGLSGTDQLEGIYVGNTRVWPSQFVFADGFDYESDQILKPANWIQNGTSPYFIQSVSGNAAIFNNTTDGNHSCKVVWAKDSLTDIQYSKGTIVNIGNSSRQYWTLIHSDESASNFVGFQWAGNSLTLFTSINGATVARATATKTQVVGDALEVRSSTNGSGQAVYTGYVNGTSYATWTDTSSLARRGSDYRRQGFGMNRNRAFFASTISTQFSYWEGGDY